MYHYVFRHGERTPADTYPNDPNINNTFEPYGWGQLTNKGKMDLYEMGQWLMKRYQDFFTGGYPGTEDVEVMTTDVDRTKMSAALVLAGLFPPEGKQIWNPDLLWQPIPTSHQMLSEDMLLLVRKCPRYSEALSEVMKSPEVQEIQKKYQKIYDYIQNNTGSNITNPDDVQSVYSTLKAEKDLGLPLEKWTEKVFPEDMSEITALSFILNAYNDELKRLKGGPLLKKIVTDSLNKAKGTEESKKMYMYVGHDSTISNLMLAANVWQQQIPTYNILAIFEVREEGDNYFMKVLLRNNSRTEPFNLEIPGCPEPCGLTQFYESVKPHLPDNLEEECRPKDSGYTPPPPGGP